MIPSTGGRFALTVGDKQLYSKLETGRFPEEEALVKAVGEALGV